MPKQPKQSGPDISYLQPKMTANDAAVETLAGDVRDVMLTHFRDIKIPWAMLSEQEQTDKIEALESLGRDLVRRAVYMIAASDMPVVHVKIGKWTVGDAVEVKIGAAAMLDNIRKLAEHGPNAAVLVLADPGAYMGEREKAKADPDEPPLFDKDTGEINPK